MKQRPKPGDIIAVWFSCGAASAVAAKKTIEKYGHMCEIYILNTPIKEEHPDNRRFLSDVSKWLNKEIILVTNSDFPKNSCVEIWDNRKYMSGIKGAPCTLLLKKEARYKYEVNNKVDWHVLGFTCDERDRYENFIKFERENTLGILIDESINKDDCYQIINDAGIDLPEMYYLGYPNANCIGCVKATSPTYWNHVRLMHPDVFSERAIQSRKLGVRLVRYKGKRIFLDELPIDAKGRDMKSMNIECGIFCIEESLNRKK